MNASRARKFRLLAKAISDNEAEYKKTYKTFKKVYGSAKKPGQYFWSCAMFAKMVTDSKEATLGRILNDELKPDWEKEVETSDEN